MSVIRRDLLDGVAVLSFDNQAAKANTLSHAALQELETQLDAIEAAPAGLRGVVLASSKPGFVAGADLREVQTMESAEDARRMVSWVSSIQRRIETCPVPVVAAINGTAMGGGFELALACHGRVGTPDTRLGLPELNLGLMPAAGGTQRLPRLIGLEPAMEVILGGKVLTAEEALALGILSEVLEPDALLAGACALAAGLTPRQPWQAEDWRLRPAPGSVEAEALFAAAETRAKKRAADGDIAETEIIAVLREGWGQPLDQALTREIEGFARLAPSVTAKNRIRVGFFGPQALRAQKTRPSDQPPTRLERIAVVGGGLMGGGIAWTAACNSLGVTVIEADAAGVERTRNALERIAERQVKRRQLSSDGARAVLARIAVHPDWPDLGDCDAGIEAVPEVASIKATVLARLAAALPADALIASNTSTMAITGLAAHVARPDMFVGMHFFSPVEVMPLLEIISGSATSPRALAMALDLAKAMRKLPITVNDGPGFYTSRIVGTYTGEALTLLAEGVAPEVIDGAARAFGMPIGPLAMADTVGIALLRDIYGALAAGGSPVVERGCRAREALCALYEAGRRSRPQGGIYDYDAEGRQTHGWPGLIGLFPRVEPLPDADTVKMRLFHVQSLEAMRAIEDGIITDPTQIDVASTLGWGFPKTMGGVLSWVDTCGAARFLAEVESLAARYGDRFAPPRILQDLAARGGGFHAL